MLCFCPGPKASTKQYLLELLRAGVHLSIDDLEASIKQAKVGRAFAKLSYGRAGHKRLWTGRL